MTMTFEEVGALTIRFGESKLGQTYKQVVTEGSEILPVVHSQVCGEWEGRTSGVSILPEPVGGTQRAGDGHSRSDETHVQKPKVDREVGNHQLQCRHASTWRPRRTLGIGFHPERM